MTARLLDLLRVANPRCRFHRTGIRLYLVRFHATAAFGTANVFDILLESATAGRDDHGLSEHGYRRYETKVLSNSTTNGEIHGMHFFG